MQSKTLTEVCWGSIHGGPGYHDNITLDPCLGRTLGSTCRHAEVGEEWGKGYAKQKRGVVRVSGTEDVGYTG